MEFLVEKPGSNPRNVGWVKRLRAAPPPIDIRWIQRADGNCAGEYSRKPHSIVLKAGEEGDSKGLW